MTVYSATPGMVHDLPGQPAPAPVPGQVPGAKVTTSDLSAVQTMAQRMRAMYPQTVGMRFGDEAPAPVPGSAPMPGEVQPQPQDPAVANYTFDLPQGFVPDEVQLGELKALAVEHKLEPATTSKLVALHAQALATQQAQLDAEIAGWAEKSRALPEWTDPQRPAALEAVRGVLPPSARIWLESTAFGSHPEVVKLVLSLGREIVRLRGVPTGSGEFKNTPGMRP